MEQSTGVYISYPFCAQKCTYCNFASGVFPASLESEYQKALHSEIATYQWIAQPGGAVLIVDTVYLGGGTPSQMDPASLASLLEAIPNRPWSEATLETAPGTVTEEKCSAWMDAGINRISLGVQSFVQRELARTGRKHTADVVLRDVAMLRNAGIANINIDLIAGLPGQTLVSWAESLAWIERLAIPHVSIYMLEVDEDSRLGQEVLLNGKRFGAPDVAGDDEIAAMYESAVERLGRLGIHRYEISNFARPGFESLHNLKYWRLEPYVGFGADAHSFDGVQRAQNVESADEYVARWKSGQHPQVGSVSAQKSEEKFFVGLRLSEGVHPHPDEWQRWNEPIERFVASGLLESDGGRLRLTDRGVLLSNEVFAEFVS